MTPSIAPMTPVSEQERASMTGQQGRRYTVTLTDQHKNGICEGILAYEGLVVRWSAMLPGFERASESYLKRTDAPVHNIWVNADKDRVLVAALIVHYFQNLHDSQWREADLQRKREAAAHAPTNNYGLRL